MSALRVGRYNVSKKNYLLVSGTLFCLVSAAHLLRILYTMSVVIEGYTVPMYLSWFGFIVPAILATWAFRLARSPEQT